MKRVALAIGMSALGAVAAVSVPWTPAAVRVMAASQNTSAGPDSFSAPQGGPGGPGFGRSRPGGPGGPGGPMGRGGPGGMMGPGGPVDLPLARLGLSSQQQDQVQGIVQSHQDEMRGLGDHAMAAQDALEAAIFRRHHRRQHDSCVQRRPRSHRSRNGRRAGSSSSRGRPGADAGSAVAGQADSGTNGTRRAGRGARPAGD